MSVISAIKRIIRKYDERTGSSGIPKAQVEVYLRDSEGGVFHVPTLHEGILHLLSNEGYRLGVYESPDSAALNERYAVVVFRNGENLGVKLEAPILSSTGGLDKVKIDLSRADSIQVVQPQSAPDLYKEVEVTIDGQ